MQSIATLFQQTVSLPEPRPKRGGINSERAAVTAEVCTLMTGQGTFKYWLGRTRRLSPSAIRDMMKEAQGGNNPQALFQWLLKKQLKVMSP